MCITYGRLRNVWLASAIVFLPSLTIVETADLHSDAASARTRSIQFTTYRQSPPRQPLFESQEVLHLTITTDLDAVRRDVGADRDEHPATLSYTDDNGELVELEATVQARGKFRRDWRVCDFPPLMLDLKKRTFPADQLVGTLFENQNELKLVCHCQHYDEAYQQFVLKEYLAYRIYQLFTELSFSVRLARVTYEDIDGGPDPVTRFAFFIEDDKMLAERNGGVLLDSLGVSHLHLDNEYAALFSFFQYFIGNTDWKVSALHNVMLLRIGVRFPIAVPYDFDWAGLVEPPYAAPHPDLGTRDLRERVFISPCLSDYDVKRMIQMFNERRNDIYGLFAGLPALRQRSVESMRDYIDDFYDLVNDPRKVGREFARTCGEP